MAGRALVLGSGGVTGIAWELGVLAGLAAVGVDPTRADLLVATSAGAVVAAQVTSGVPLEDLYAAQLAGRADEVSARMGARLRGRYLCAILRSRDARGYGMRMGRLAAGVAPVPPQRRRAVIGSRLPSPDWPAQRLLITAVDAVSGELVAFDAASGVPLVDAVGASCAVPGVWPPVRINGRDYIDGGMRSPANADLAAGFGSVVILAQIARGGGPIARVASQAATLRAAGARVALVVPDRAARRAIGRHLLDPRRAAAAARAGRAQAAAAAGSVAQAWAPGPDRTGAGGPSGG